MNDPRPAPDARTPDGIKQRADLDIAPLLLPDPARVFADRALRLREQAAAHPMRDYLMLMAVVCEAQHARLQHGAEVLLPDAVRCGATPDWPAPLFDAERWPRAAQWRTELRLLLAQVLDEMPPDSPARAGAQTALALADDAIEQQADRLLAGISLGLDLASAPLIAAGLQLYFTRLAGAAGAALPRPWQVADNRTHCPCCGTLPTASITRLGGAQEGQRYLQCALCSAQWRMNRIQCARCLATQGIRYQSLRPIDQDQPSAAKPAVEAETCDACRHYLKIVHMDSDLHVEPLADDLASLTLDLLLADAGFARHGLNLLLLFGDAGADVPAADEVP